MNTIPLPSRREFLTTVTAGLSAAACGLPAGGAVGGNGTKAC